MDWKAFIGQIDMWALYVVIALILGNLFLGLIEAIKYGKTELTKMGDWIVKRLIPMSGGYLFAVFIGTLPAMAGTAYAEWFKALPLTTFAFIVMTIGGKIKTQFQDIFPGLPIPDIPILEKGKAAADPVDKST